MSGTGTAMLLLADGRFPAGGHAHSGGVEAAVADGRVRDEAMLEAFVRGRLTSVGLGEAALAAATVLRCGRPWPDAVDALAELDTEAEARVPAPPLRIASRRLGRQLLRAAGRCWPHRLIEVAAETAPDGLHQPVALGVAGVAAGLSAEEVAALAVHHSITTPAQAAVRLLGLDPYAVAAITASLSVDGERVVADALDAAAGPLALLPARTGPLVDIAAIEHGGRDDRLFAT